MKETVLHGLPVGVYLILGRAAISLVNIYRISRSIMGGQVWPMHVPFGSVVRAEVPICGGWEFDSWRVQLAKKKLSLAVGS